MEIVQEDGWTDRELNEYAARPQSVSSCLIFVSE